MNVLWMLLAFGAGLLLLYILARLLIIPLKWMGKLLLSSVCGFVILLALNMLGGPLLGFTLPLSPFNALVVGVLGTPGLLILVLLQVL